jgi:hypothetical protein
MHREKKSWLKIVERDPKFICPKIQLITNDSVEINYNNAFKIKYGESKGFLLRNIEFTKQESEFVILLDKSKIVINKKEIEEFVEYFDLNVVFTYLNDGTTKTYSENLKLKFLPEHGKLETGFELSDRFSDFVYRPQVFDFGAICFKNNTKQRFAFPLFLTSLKFYVIDDENKFKPEQAVFFDFESISYIENSALDYGHNKEGFFINNILPTDSQYFNLKIDFSKLQNPIDKEIDYTCTLDGFLKCDNKTIEKFIEKIL